MTKDEIKKYCQNNQKVKFDGDEYYIVEINDLKQEAGIRKASGNPFFNPMIYVKFNELENDQ